MNMDTERLSTISFADIYAFHAFCLRELEGTDALINRGLDKREMNMALKEKERLDFIVSQLYHEMRERLVPFEGMATAYLEGQKA